MGVRQRGPTTPPTPKRRRFGLFPGRSPLLGESLLFSSPRGTKMFQFSRFATCITHDTIEMVGCPIRKSADQRSFAPSRGLSQLITSFIASMSQGIRHAPFLAFSYSSAIAGTSCTAAHTFSFVLHRRRLKLQRVSSVSFYLLCLCQNVKDLLPDAGLGYRQRKRGEQRIRTVDPLLAKQVL